MGPSRRRALALVGLLLAGPAALAHGFHTTTAEIFYRPAQARLQVSLLIAQEDLEHALGEASTEGQLVEYLRKTFRVRTPRGLCELKFRGTEAVRRGLWLHFEILDLPSLEGAVLEHRVLLDTEPFAFHTVELHFPGQPVRVHTLDRSQTQLVLLTGAPAVGGGSLTSSTSSSTPKVGTPALK